MEVDATPAAVDPSWITVLQHSKKKKGKMEPVPSVCRAAAPIVLWKGVPG